jgi:hypothetical protein
MVKRQGVLSQRKLEIVTKSKNTLGEYRIYTTFEIFPDLSLRNWREAELARNWRNETLFLVRKE